MGDKDELRRRLVHATGAGLPLLYLLGVSWSVVQWLLIGLLGSVTVLEFLRLGVGLDWWVYRRLTRPYEDSSVAGYALYALGMATVGLLFAPEVAVPAMLMLAIGDPIGGLLAGEDPTPVKRPLAIGTVGGVCFVLAVPFVPTGVAGMMALTAAIADGVFLRIGDSVVDDNLAIPIGAALVGTAGLAVV